MAVRIGFVGLGIIAETHLAVLAEMPQAVLVFTADPRSDRAPIEFRGGAVPHHPTLADALVVHGTDAADLIVLATPTPTHADLAVEALSRTTARVLVEKPLVHEPTELDRLASLAGDGVDLGRVAVAHHFAFSPEVRWAAGQIEGHPDWGPVTAATVAFHDPYILLGEHAFSSYVSSWMDSGVNQLSMLTRFVDLVGLTARHEDERGASAWCTAAYEHRGEAGTARLRTSWLTGASSKESVLTLGRAGVEVWVDHTAMTGFTARGTDLLATFDSDTEPPRKIAHYRPLYETLLSGADDPVLRFETAATVTRLLHARPG
jgi:predicted dehydrogenase